MPWFIGNQNCVDLGQSGKPASLERAEKLTGKAIEFYEVDLLDEPKLKQVFNSTGPFECVIHFAALKAVGESCQIPLKYYGNNITGSISLLNVRTHILFLAW